MSEWTENMPKATGTMPVERRARAGSACHVRPAAQVRGLINGVGGNLAHSAPLRTCFGWGARRKGEGSDKSDRLDELDRSD